MVKELSDTDFWQEVEKSCLLYVVDFWAIWSQSCILVSQALEEIARQYDGKINFGKVNVDNEIKTANECDIQNIPTILFYLQGKEAERIVGSVNKEILVAKIKKYVPKKIKKDKESIKEIQ